MVRISAKAIHLLGRTLAARNFLQMSIGMSSEMLSRLKAKRSNPSFPFRSNWRKIVTMNKTVLILLSGVLFLTGCARNYVMTLSNGERIWSKGKPHLVEGIYFYKDASGHQQRVQAYFVREIAPPSMVTDQNAAFKPVSSK